MFNSKKTNTSEQAESRRPQRKKKRLSIMQFLITLFMVGAIAVVGVFAYAFITLPPFDPAKLTGDINTVIYDDKDQFIASLQGEQNRSNVRYDQIPKHTIQAFVAIEDQKFFSHYGINIFGIARAVLSNITSGDLKGQGASTITQQLAKNAFLSLEKSWERKIKEIILAFKLEAKYSKEEIMGFYLNKVYFGAGAHGVQTAANIYFGKGVSDLNLAESALLAGLVQSPSNYDPFIHMDRAKKRQQAVLNNMVECEFITAAQAQAAYDQEIVLNQTANVQKKQYGFYVDAVVEEAIKILSEQKISNPENIIYGGGLKIYTTLDAKTQLLAEQVYSDANNFPNLNKDGKTVQSAMAVVRTNDSAVIALIGGREYTNQRGFNRATSALRQPGSAIKPLTVYAPALERGQMPYTVFNDAPVSFKLSNGQIWKPQNYDHSYRGPITMRTAVQYSINTYAVQCLDSIGVRAGFDFGKALGLPLIDLPGKNDLALAPLSLGGLTKGVSPLNMAAAYAAFANKGMYTSPYLIKKIVDSDDKILYEHAPKVTKAMTPETAWLMTNMLETVVSSGTGTRAKIPNVPTAGKTGTTDEYTNAWFCGYTPTFAAAVWIGFDDQNKSMGPQAGGNFPAKIFNQVVTKAQEGLPAGSFTMPEKITKISISAVDGKLPSNDTPAEQIITEYGLAEYAPKEVSTAFKTIIVCPDSGLLPTPYCPETVTKSVLVSDPEITEECTIHTRPEITLPVDPIDPIDPHHAISPDDTGKDEHEDNSTNNNTSSSDSPPPAVPPIAPINDSNTDSHGENN